MSYNITLDVTEDGTVTVDTNASYTVTARPGRYAISGHVVPDGEDGHEYVAVSTPAGDIVNGGHRVVRDSA